jgi:RNA polymerase primary sigma factor
MRTQGFLDADGPRRWLLDAPEAQVISAAKERELLLELAECRRFILRATRRPDGSEWDLARPDAEFRRAVRDLAGGNDGRGDGPPDAAGPPDEPTASAIWLRARRYEEIRGALAMANARLVAYIARRYLNRGISPADLIQEGFCGLLEAIDRFDPVNTTRLATYAAWWIRQALQRAIAGTGYPVRLSPRQLRRLAQSLSQGSGSAGKEVPPAGLAPSADRPAPASAPVPHRESAPWHELAAIRPRISLDAVSRVDESTPLVELLTSLPDADAEADELNQSVDSLLAALSPREQFILRLRFGLDGEARHSLGQIGEFLAISKERVRQIQDRALRKLRDAARPVPETPSRLARKRPG